MEWSAGDVRIVKLVEREVLVPLHGLLRDVPEGAADRYPWLRPDFVAPGGEARLSIHGLVVDTGERRLLVDTCIGEHGLVDLGTPDGPGFLGALADAGYGVDDVDTVVCTHLHFDHVGWNTRLVDGEWAVTFQSARYLFGRTEWAHWSGTDGDYVNVGETVQPPAGRPATSPRPPARAGCSSRDRNVGRRGPYPTSSAEVSPGVSGSGPTARAGGRTRR